MIANFRNLPWIHGGVRFPLISLPNIAMISLQQAHTTFRPFKHRVIKKWVYGVEIAVVWVLAAIVSASLVHCTVLSELILRMPATTVKEVCYRKTKAIDIEAFKEDLRKSRLCQDPPVVLTDLVSCYGSTMTSLLGQS